MCHNIQDIGFYNYKYALFGLFRLEHTVDPEQKLPRQPSDQGPHICHNKQGIGVLNDDDALISHYSRHRFLTTLKTFNLVYNNLQIM